MSRYEDRQEMYKWRARYARLFRRSAYATVFVSVLGVVALICITALWAVVKFWFAMQPILG